ncbi:hypothetical protein MWMV18_MWMV18_00979 [Acinetobacter calcoaceticus]|nr:hypothetical protein MWMV18_MWMV18_00979 [Acinetobacter calcoaceticus]
MKRQFLALSIVAPNGTRIAEGIKTLEVRSWVTTKLPIKDLLIVENQNYLVKDTDEEQGVAVLWLISTLFMLGEMMKLSQHVQLLGARDILLGF